MSNPFAIIHKNMRLRRGEHAPALGSFKAGLSGKIEKLSKSCFGPIFFFLIFRFDFLLFIEILCSLIASAGVVGPGKCSTIYKNSVLLRLEPI